MCLLLLELVFFPADIADLAGEPSLHPVPEIGDCVFRPAAQALGLGRYFEVLYFNFRHRDISLLRVTG